jgi:hypothetical protein
MKNVIESIVKNIVSNKNSEKAVKFMKMRNLRSYVRKSDIVNFKRIEALKNSVSNNWGTQAKGASMTNFVELSENELQTRAKSLICNILQKTKCKFTHNQVKLAIDCCTKEELVRAFNSSHYNTDALLSLVGRKCQKYNNNK